MTDADLAQRRAAAAELGDAIRVLSEAVVRTEASPETVRETANRVRQIASVLSSHVRTVRQVASIDDLASGIRSFSPVTGLGHPASLPVQRETREDGATVGRAVLGARFEGPPGLLHGGVIALVFDEILGWAAAHDHAHGLTAHLDVDFRHGIPLDEEILVVARVTRREGRKVWAEAEMSLARDPDRAMARARALFVWPRADLRTEYFGTLTDATGRRQSGPDTWEAPTA